MGNVATDDALAKFVEKLVLNSPLDWTSTKLWIIPCLGDDVKRIICDIKRDAIAGNHLNDLVHLKLHNLLDFFLAERREGDNVVHTVQETQGGRCCEAVHA